MYLHQDTLRKNLLRLNMKFEAKLLRRAVKALVLEQLSRGKLRVFDFDDTLVQTDARVYVTNDSGVTVMTPAEYAVYEPRQGDEFDYSEFQKLINPREIAWTLRIFRRVYDKCGASGVKILTARQSPAPASQFLEDAGMPGVEVIALGSSDPEDKASWIADKIASDDLSYVEFFDDSLKNVTAVENLKSKFPNVKIVSRHVMHKKR